MRKEGLQANLVHWLTHSVGVFAHKTSQSHLSLTYNQIYKYEVYTNGIIGFCYNTIVFRQGTCTHRPQFSNL